MNKLAFDKSLFGNAFLEIVTDEQRSFLSLFHQDASKCRVARDGRHVLLHHNWAGFVPAQAQSIAIFPNFEPAADGLHLGSQIRHIRQFSLQNSF